MEKPIIWMGQSKKELCRMSEVVMDEVGFALHLVQNGSTPDSATKMKGNLREVMEIHVDDDGDTYRTMYTTKLEGVVYVLDAFKKKSKRGHETPQSDLDRIHIRLNAAKAHHAKYGSPELE